METDAGGIRRALRIPEYAPLVCVILLALALRLYRLGNQAVDYDEMHGLLGLRGTGFVNSLRLSLEVNNRSMPLYYFLQYFASDFIGTSVVAIRALSVAFNVVTIPFLYFLGRDLFGRRAGLIAAVLFALSPAHIYTAQMIRHYALFTPIAAISLYVFCRYVQSGGRGWFNACVVANLLLVLTHFFGVLLVGCEVGFLILFSGRPFRQTIAWCFAQFVVFLLPCSLWIYANISAPEQFFIEWQPPTFKEVLFDIAGDDVVGMGDGPAYSNQRWSFFPERWAPGFFRNRYIADWAMLLLFLATMGSQTWRVLRISLRAPPSQRKNASTGPALFLLMSVVLPVLALAIASYLYRPCIQRRFTPYGSLALYVIAGGVISGIRRDALRTLAVAALVFLYAVQLSIIIPGPTRTDWLAADAYIRAHQTPDDLILISGEGADEKNANIFHCNTRRIDIPIAPAFTLQAVCDKAVCHLDRTRGGSDARPSVWALFKRAFSVPFRNFDQCLASRGLVFDVRDYPVCEGLILYRIQAGPDFPVRAHSMSLLVDADVDYEKLLADWGVRYEDPAKQEAATRTLRRIFEASPPTPGGYPLDLFCTWLAEEGSVDVALDVVRAAMARGYNEGEARGIEAFLRFGRGDLDGARVAVDEALRLAPASLETQWTMLYLRLMSEPFERVSPTLDSYTFFMYRPLLEAMFLKKDPALARWEIHGLYAADQDIPLGIMRHLDLCYWLTPCPMQP